MDAKEREFGKPRANKKRLSFVLKNEKFEVSNMEALGSCGCRLDLNVTAEIPHDEKPR
jgi:hypothetical protein